MFESFLDCERTKETIQGDAGEDNTGDRDEIMDTSGSHIGEDESNDLLQSILQYQAKFLICHVETKKGDNQTTKKLIINNLILNMRKKTNEFTKCIIPNVLKGKQRLVDKALEENITHFTYQSREPIREASRIRNVWKHSMSGPDKLHSIAFGQGFSTFKPLDFSRDLPAVKIPILFSVPTVLPFMRLEIFNNTDAKGQLQSVAKWLDDKNFLQELFEIITCQVESLEKILTDIRVFLDNKEKETNEEITTEKDAEVVTFLSRRNTLRQQHLFFKKKNADAYSFSFPDFFLDWKPQFLRMHEHFQGKTEQPSISEKMVLVDCCFEECLQLFDTKDEKTATIIRYKINEALTSIMTSIRTSSLNIAIVGILSHNEFAVCDVLRDPYSKQLYSSAKEMSEYIGSQHMALVAQAGIAYFDMGKIRRFKSVNETKTKREKDDDGSVSEEPEDDKLSTQIINLVTGYELPKVEVLQKMLKTAFAQLERKQFLLLQSILPCLWTLQEWTRPLDYHEEKRTQLLGNSKRGKTIDLTDKNGEFETEAKKKMKRMTFKKLTNTITTAPANVASSSGNVTVENESEHFQTPTSDAKSRKNPKQVGVTSSTLQSGMKKSTTVTSDTNNSVNDNDHSRKDHSNTSGTHLYYPMLMAASSRQHAFPITIHSLLTQIFYNETFRIKQRK